jgi:ABC-type amino acid transport substrate-binding protein
LTGARIARGVAAVAALLFISGCGGDEKQAEPASKAAATPEAPAFKTVKDGCITVAFPEGSLPRVATTKDQTGLTGYEGVLLTEVAKRSGKELCRFPTDFASMILSVGTGKADVAVSIYYTAERSKQVYYTRPDVHDPLTFIFKSDVNYTGPDDLKSLKAGSVGSWAYTPYMQEFWGKKNLLEAPGQTELMQMLRGGQIGVTIAGGAGPAPMIASDPANKLQAKVLAEGDLGIPETMRVSPAHMVVNCQNKELAAEIDKVLVEWTESGKWAEVVKEMGVVPPAEEVVPPASVGQPQQGC